MINRIATLTATAAILAGGMVAVDMADAPSASAATCYSRLTESGAQNNSCRPKMRHWVVSRQSGTHYGPTVTPGHYSGQSACYVNVASRGVTVRS
jgi:hypothetical protein